MIYPYRSNATCLFHRVKVSVTIAMGVSNNQMNELQTVLNIGCREIKILNLIWSYYWCHERSSLAENSKVYSI